MTSKNKRKHERIHSLNLSYLCLDEDNNIVKQGMGRSLNISESGMLLETHFAVDSKHQIQLTLSLEEDLLDIKGEPVHVRSVEGGKYQIGIKFLDLDDEGTALLKKFIREGGLKNEPDILEDQ